MKSKEPKDEVMVGFAAFLGELEDPRVERGKHHSLYNVLWIALAGAICGVTGWKDLAIFAKAKRAWLERHLDLPHGVPGKDTFRRVFEELCPHAFRSAFRQWVQSLAESLKGQQVALDGKTLCGSLDRATGTMPIHLVHAFVVEQRLLLAQIRGAGKAGELDALPWLLELLEIEGSTVTIDAAGCHRNIAQCIRERNAHYLLTLKENQPKLYGSIAQFFLDAQTMQFEGVEVDVARTEERGHGRHEERRAYVLHDLQWCDNAEGWRDLNTAVMIERVRKTGDQIETTTHFYISSIERLSASRALQLIRGHWQIENGLHWTLDVTFGEDLCRIRHRNGAENFALLRRVALNTLKHGAKKYDSVRALQKRAGWDDDFLLSRMGATQLAADFESPHERLS